MMPANPNLLPVSEADRVRAADFCTLINGQEVETSLRIRDGQLDAGWYVQAFTAHRLAAEQAQTSAFVAMLEGMKRDSLPGCNAVIYEAIANAKALGKGRVGS